MTSAAGLLAVRWLRRPAREQSGAVLSTLKEGGRGPGGLPGLCP